MRRLFVAVFAGAMALLMTGVVAPGQASAQEPVAGDQRPLLSIEMDRCVSAGLDVVMRGDRGLDAVAVTETVLLNCELLVRRVLAGEATVGAYRCSPIDDIAARDDCVADPPPPVVVGPDLSADLRAQIAICRFDNNVAIATSESVGLDAKKTARRIVNRCDRLARRVVLGRLADSVYVCGSVEPSEYLFCRAPHFRAR